MVQFLRDVVWSAADYLIVDLPPGTGDVALSLAQNCAITGAVLVTTPQHVSIADVVRARTMFQAGQGPGARDDRKHVGLHRSGHGRSHRHFFERRRRRSRAADGHSVLGSIPIDPQISIGGDSGVPIVISHPDSTAAKAFCSAAEKLAAQISIHVLTVVHEEKSSGMAHAFV